MRAARVALCAVVLWLGCGPSRVEELDAELERLGKERIAREQVERVRAEADVAEAALGKLRAEEGDAGARQSAESVRREARARALERARADLESERASLEGIREQIARERAAAQGLDQEIARRREEARPLRDQAAALERELRPGDAAWVTERRVQVLAELAQRIARTYPSDPVLASLAKDTRAETARERAATLRARITWIYELDVPTGAARAS